MIRRGRGRRLLPESQSWLFFSAMAAAAATAQRRLEKNVPAVNVCHLEIAFKQSVSSGHILIMNAAATFDSLKWLCVLGGFSRR